MKYNNNTIAGGANWHLAYHPFEYLDIPQDIQCPWWKDNGWMQQGGLGPAKNSPIVCVVLPLDSWNYCSGEQARQPNIRKISQSSLYS